MVGAGLTQTCRLDCVADVGGDARFGVYHRVECGRLTRVSRSCSDAKSVAYIVAVAQADQAIAIIRSVVGTNAAIEDLGRVSDALVRSLGLLSGEFVRIDRTRI